MSVAMHSSDADPRLIRVETRAWGSSVEETLKCMSEFEVCLPVVKTDKEPSVVTEQTGDGLTIHNGHMKFHVRF